MALSFCLFMLIMLIVLKPKYSDVSVASAYLLGNSLNGPAVQQCWLPCAAAALLGHPDHGSARCFLPMKTLPHEIYASGGGLLVATLV